VVLTDGLEARVASDLADIDRRAWEGLTQPSLYVSYDWLRARSGTIKGQCRFILVSTRRGELILGIPAYLVDGLSHPGYDPARVLAVDDLRDRELEPASPGARTIAALRLALAERAPELRPALIASAPGRSAGVAYAPGLDDRARRRALQVAVATANRQAMADSAPTLCWLYLPEGEDDALDRVLRGHGYRSVVVDAECYMPVRWCRFDDYLAQFGSVRRRSIRHEIRVLAAAGVQVTLQGAEALGPELARLELQWRTKYRRATSLAEIEAHYAELRAHLPGALRVFVANRDGRALGFVAFFEDNDTWYARFGGFETTEPGLYLYFNLLFYHPLEAAIGRGIECIRYSLKAYETKCSRGCSLRNVLAYVRLPRAFDEQVHSSLAVVDGLQRHRFARFGAKDKGR
jgi:uncharacterized protein